MHSLQIWIHILPDSWNKISSIFLNPCKHLSFVETKINKQNTVFDPGTCFLCFDLSCFFRIKGTVLGPLATALTTTPTFMPAATVLALAAGNLSAKEEWRRTIVLSWMRTSWKVSSFLLSFLPGSFASFSMPWITHWRRNSTSYGVIRQNSELKPKRWWQGQFYVHVHENSFFGSLP